MPPRHPSSGCSSSSSSSPDQAGPVAARTRGNDTGRQTSAISASLPSRPSTATSPAPSAESSKPVRFLPPVLPNPSAYEDASTASARSSTPSTSDRSKRRTKFAFCAYKPKIQIHTHRRQPSLLAEDSLVTRADLDDQDILPPYLSKKNDKAHSPEIFVPSELDSFLVLPFPTDSIIQSCFAYYLSDKSIPTLSRKFLPIAKIMAKRRDHWVPHAINHPASASSLLTFILTSAHTPRSIISEPHLRRHLDAALRHTNTLLRDPATSTGWTALMSVIFLLITAQQMGDIEAANAHARGLFAILRARSTDLECAERLAHCQQSVVMSTQFGLKELYDQGLTPNDRRITILPIFPHPEIMAACNTDTEAMDLLLHHTVIASNAGERDLKPPNHLEQVISNTVAVLGSFFRSEPADFTKQAVHTAVQDTADLYGLSEPCEPKINFEETMEAHPGVHAWIGLTHGMFAMRPHPHQGFVEMLRTAVDMKGISSFGELMAYLDEAFMQHPAHLLPYLHAFWNEAFDG